MLAGEGKGSVREGGDAMPYTYSNLVILFPISF